MSRPLDPTLDVVFKLMFTRGPGAAEALIGLLTCILWPPSPIVSLRVLNPQIAPLLPGEKAISLDILVALADGSLCVVEMQTTRHRSFLARLAFYLARAFVEQLPSGTSYDKLRRAVCIGLLADDDPRYPRGHTRIGLRRDGAEHRETDLLALHVVNLPYLLREAAEGTLPPEDNEVLRWARFLLAESQDEATTIATGHSAMEKANTTLQGLFDDEDARMLARSREIGLRMYRAELAESREEGIAAGREEGIAAGREQGIAAGREEGIAAGREEGIAAGREALQRSIRAMCAALSIPISAGREAWLERATIEVLAALPAQLATGRAWPEPEPRLGAP